MSSIYVLEPVTKGKVVLKTTLGDVEIELWPKEAPKTVRNFVQLCLEGYYDKTIFHRIVKNFICQGGDPTGTGDGGESIYGHPFADEFHQRLRFNHRGLVAMANTGPNTNQSQFFITLEATPELDRKNAIFGKVVGDTIFNVLKVNDLEVDEHDRPVYPPKLLSVDVLYNPFEDIVPRQIRKEVCGLRGLTGPAGGIVPLILGPQSVPSVVTPLAKTAPVKKNLSLLSFAGEEEEEEQEELPLAKKSASHPRGKSAYHFSDDPRVAKEVEEAERMKEEVRRKLQAEREKKRAEEESLRAEKTQAPQGNFDERMREKLREHATKMKEKSRDDEAAAEHMGHLEREQQRLKEEIREAAKPSSEERKESWVDEQRRKYLKRKLAKSERQKAVVERLRTFKDTIRSVAEAPSGVRSDSASSGMASEGEADSSRAWLSHELRFEKEALAKTSIDAALVQRPGEDDYVVFDPLQGKAPEARPSRHQQRLNASLKKTEKW